MLGGLRRVSPALLRGVGWARSPLRRGSGSAATSAEDERSKLVVPLNFVKINAKRGDAAKNDVAGEQAQRTTAFPPVIVIHGVLASAGTYRSVLKRSDFAPFRDVYAIDVRNHGGSPHVSEMTYEAITRDVKSFMSGEGIDSACIIGHSMGGKVGMLLALEEPARVSELVVLDIAPKTYCNSYSMTPALVAAKAMYAVDPESLRSRQEVDAALEAQGVTDPRIRGFLMTNLVSDESRPGYYTWRLNIQSIEDALEHLQTWPEVQSSSIGGDSAPATTPRYDGKVLFLSGESSSYITAEDHAAVHALFPSAQIRTVPGSGHWIVSDNPNHFVEAVNTFLGDEEHEYSSQ